MLFSVYVVDKKRLSRTAVTRKTNEIADLGK
jgi:hypothetical protein